MSTRLDDDDADASGGRSNTIAAIFATEKAARDAIKNLHKAGFKQTWIGKTREDDRTTGEPMVEGGTDVFARFLSAGADRRPLHRALMERGVTEAQARTVENDVAPGCLVITVYAEDNPQRVADIINDENGEVVSASHQTPPAVTLASRDPRTGVDDRNGRPSGDADRSDIGDDLRSTPMQQYDLDDPRAPMQRGDFLATGSSTDIEGYETEEFIAIDRGRDLSR